MQPLGLVAKSEGKTMSAKRKMVAFIYPLDSQGHPLDVHGLPGPPKGLGYLGSSLGIARVEQAP
jgi:hypothetical protein